MQELQERYGEDYPPVRDYRKLKEGASETVRSIVIMVNAQLRLFEIPEIKRIFEGTDDIDIPSLGLGVDGNPEKRQPCFLLCHQEILLIIFLSICFIHSYLLY